MADESQNRTPLDASPGAVPAREGKPGASVLVVEDDPRSARVAMAHLEGAGYRVAVAHTAAEAQQCVAQELPDLVLCDVCLPDMDGIRLTSWMRGRPATAHLPIALITSSDDRQILAKGLEAGADAFLAKPVNSLELRSRVRSLLRSKLYVDELRAREQAALQFDRQQTSASPGDWHTSGPHLPLALVIEDSPRERRLLEACLQELGCATRGVASVTEALASLHESRPDLIVLDLLLPERDGYDFIATFQNECTSDRVPILVVSAMSEVQDRVKALELGADDFIVKGFERSEFEARVRRLLRLKLTLDELNSRCSRALRLAITDSLTGLYTFGFMHETLRSQMRVAQDGGQPYSVIFADLDHFKQVNDRHGHAAGDKVLRKVAEALQLHIRRTDTLVRYGGEEFVCLLPHTGGQEAQEIAKAMRSAVADLEINLSPDAALRVTMSLGVASFPDDALDGETLLQRGDAAMYQAKQLGRNRVSAAGEKGTPKGDVARILLVDDDERNLRLLEAYLTPAGHELLYAKDGVEAIEVSLKQRPDVIIMDALMPHLCGFDACLRMKQDPRTQLVPIMLVTSLNARDDRLRGIEAGADDFITKPIDKTQLLSRLRALLRQKRGTDLLEDAEAVIFALARAVEARDSSLGDHVERVADSAVRLGQALGLGERELAALRRAGIVHDIGKIYIPDPILLKKGPLTPEERLIIQQHPDFGYSLLQPLRTFADCLPAVRFHHERRDGSGYPLGLKGDEIPLLAQIVAIADIYDALSAPRHYKEALSAERAIEILREETRRGLHDPRLIETFISQVLPLAAPESATETSHAAI
jgi:putative two-component system response regulator